jgi:hypothetical protein
MERLRGPADGTLRVVGHSYTERHETETAMRTILMTRAGLISALAIVASLAACAPEGGANTAMVDGKLVETAAIDNSAVDRANADRAAAGSRAAAAEARLECEKARQTASNQGAVVGGITGAVVGSQVAGHGAKSEGGAIGAVAGVLAGRQIAKKDHRC